MRIIVALLLLLPRSAQPSQQQLARIFVYAQEESSVRSWQPVWCDEVLVAKIKRGRFFAIDVKPGRHVLSLEKSMPAFIEVNAGDESFVRLDSHVDLGQPPVLIINHAPPAVARIEMRFVVYIDAKQVLSTSVSRVDPRIAPEPHLKTRGNEQN